MVLKRLLFFLLCSYFTLAEIHSLDAAEEHQQTNAPRVYVKGIVDTTLDLRVIGLADIYVEGVSNLGAFQFDLIYDSTYVHLDTLYRREFFSSTGRSAVSMPMTIDKTTTAPLHRATFGAYSFGTMLGPNGTGILVTALFSIWKDGANLQLKNVLLADISGQTLFSGAGESGNFRVRVAGQSSILLPIDFRLQQNFPNPFNHQTVIPFFLNKPGQATLKIYNLLGECIATLLDDELSAGEHRIVWHARQNVSGVYYYRLRFDQVSQLNKMMLLR